jgi:hypothetical protein
MPCHRHRLGKKALRLCGIAVRERDAGTNADELGRAEVFGVAITRFELGQEIAGLVEAPRFDGRFGEMGERERTEGLHVRIGEEAQGLGLEPQSFIELPALGLAESQDA